MVSTNQGRASWCSNGSDEVVTIYGKCRYEDKGADSLSSFPSVPRFVFSYTTTELRPNVKAVLSITILTSQMRLKQWRTALRKGSMWTLPASRHPFFPQMEVRRARRPPQSHPRLRMPHLFSLKVWHRVGTYRPKLTSSC